MIWQIDNLETGMRERMRDISGDRQRWTDGEMHTAVNRGIAEMHLRVGFYVTGPVPVNDVGQYQPDSYMLDQVLFFVDGAPVVTLIKPGETPPGNSTIAAWVYNQPILTETYTLTSDITAEDTTISITSVSGTPPPVVGHVKIGLESMRYHGLGYVSATVFQLLNVERGIENGTPLSAFATAPVIPSVYADDPRLYDVITDKGASYLHSLYPTDGSPTEVQHHQWMMRWNTQQVDNFWRTYLPRKEFIRRPMRKNY